MRNIFITLSFTALFLQTASGQSWDRNMDIKKVRIEINANAFTATTFIEMEFCNPGVTEIEGLYRFRLHPSQVITAFQLDLYGKYRDGSIEEKWKATNAYNTIVGKRIDPALLTMEGDNFYSLRIYPVPAGGCRKVTMTIQQLLSNIGGRAYYELPFNVSGSVENVNVHARIAQASSAPVLLSGFWGNGEFVREGSCFLLSSEASNLYLKKPLAISIPFENQQPILCLQEAGDQATLALRLKTSVGKEFEINPSKVTVFWDVSASGRRRNIQREISFLKKYLSSGDVQQLSIITFNQRIIDTAVFSLAWESDKRWLDFLWSQEYEGATQFGCLDFFSLNTDAVLLFSTGKNSFGKMEPVPGKTSVWFVNSSRHPDSTRIEAIIGRTGGQFIDLVNLSIEEAVNKAQKTKNVLLSVTADGVVLPLQETKPRSDSNNIFFSGSVPVQVKQIILNFGSNGQVREQEVINVSGLHFCDSSSIDRVGMLSEFGRLHTMRNWTDILAFGKREKVITRNTAFIVLEKVEDYIKYKITPPKELEPYCDMEFFVKADETRRWDYRQRSEWDKLITLVDNYNKRIEAWSHDEPKIFLRPDAHHLEKSQTKSGEEPNNKNNSGRNNSMNGTAFPGDGVTLSGVEVVVTAIGQSRASKELGYSVSRVDGQEVTSAKVVNLQQGLTGKVSGLQVTTVNNSVNPGTRITLRGIRSLTGNNQPLLVINGLPVELSLLNSINPNTISNVTVLKGAAASAIYGPDGVNGVLLIETKRGKNYTRREPYYLKHLPDVDYLADIKMTVRGELLDRYRELLKSDGDAPGFYIDIAQLFYKRGLRKEAIEILFTAADIGEGNIYVSKAIGYVLETWNEFEEAIKVYKTLVELRPGDLQTYRDLALTQYRAGKYQQSINTFYKGIMSDEAEYFGSSLKAMMLQEMNAIIHLHRDSLDLSHIPKDIIRPLHHDLRIIVDSNYPTYYNKLSIIEPGNKVCEYVMREFFRPVGELRGYFETGSGYIQEYEVRNAPHGRYNIMLNYHDSKPTIHPGSAVRIPVMVRITSFQNSGKAGQKITVENVIMDNQGGQVVIGDVKFNK